MLRPHKWVSAFPGGCIWLSKWKMSRLVSFVCLWDLCWCRPLVLEPGSCAIVLRLSLNHKAEARPDRAQFFTCELTGIFLVGWSVGLFGDAPQSLCYWKHLKFVLTHSNKYVTGKMKKSGKMRLTKDWNTNRPYFSVLSSKITNSVSKMSCRNCNSIKTRWLRS